MSILYPNVPIAIGVPQVLRLTTAVSSLIAPIKLLSDFLSHRPPPRWGVYLDDGTPALQPDSIVAAEFQAEWAVLDYPIEQGGFESYNKVTRPYLARVTMTKSGKSADRTLFLQTVESLADSTDLVSIVTPERTYPNGSIVRYSYSRRATEGAQILVVELQVQEVRETAESAFTNSKEPASADTVNDGAVQAQALPKGATSFISQADLAG